MTSQSDVASGITTDVLAALSRTRVFFGHQSVGMNVLDAVPGIYAAHGMTPPRIERSDALSDKGTGAGFLSHSFIGENEKPAVKIADFDAKMRAGLGQQVNVAMMKFCCVDIVTSTDVGALLSSYRTTIAALERDFPSVTFVHATVPLMTEQRQLSKLKGRLTGSSRGSVAENVTRERLNATIRAEYGDRHLYDLATIESVAPDGSRAGGTYRGQLYYRLHDGYAADSGHLNAEGARIAAMAWLQAIAQASPK